MPKLDFTPLDLDIADEEKIMERRWAERDPNPQVQMSVRMPSKTYAKFRALCKKERRTNGEMVERMLESYLMKGQE